MNIYQYVALSNPNLVRVIIAKYGYGLSSSPNLAVALQQLVAAEGQPVLVDIIENHPDKDLFADYFSEKNAQNNPVEKKLGCNGGCSGCGQKMAVQELAPAYVNFTGAPQAVAENKRITDNTNLIMLASAVVIAFAILTKSA